MNIRQKLYTLVLTKVCKAPTDFGIMNVNSTLKEEARYMSDSPLLTELRRHVYEKAFVDMYNGKNQDEILWAKAQMYVVDLLIEHIQQMAKSGVKQGVTFERKKRGPSETT